jgi:hypothetical protein
MNRLLIISTFLVTLASCSKENPQKPPVVTDPTMKYTDLHNMPVKYQTITVLDLDGNGSIDIYFGTTLIGDPILKQDRLAFDVTSVPDVNLQVVDNSDVGKRMNKGEAIGKNPADGYMWYEITHIVLLEKVTPETGAPYWQGEFRDASHHYLPVEIIKNGQAFHGWVELSMDTIGERLILHKAAISIEADKEVKAGY